MKVEAVFAAGPTEATTNRAEQRKAAKPAAISWRYEKRVMGLSFVIKCYAISEAEL